MIWIQIVFSRLIPDSPPFSVNFSTVYRTNREVEKWSAVVRESITAQIGSIVYAANLYHIIRARI